VQEVPSDWTERYRPASEIDLEGNDRQRSQIRAWLREWEKGVPDKTGLILVGPPGIGKTTIARAIANDQNWALVELNASDSRNAASIRRHLPDSGASTSLLSFAPDGGNLRTLLLLDEVDHLQGGLGEVAPAQIRTELEKRGEGKSVGGSGDYGGKAEVLRLLKESSMPIILVCNDEMKLWGRGFGWRSRRARFLRHCRKIMFRRAGVTDLRRIARKILSAEEISCDHRPLDALISANPGDLRALVRDLQQLASRSDGHITTDLVESHLVSSVRDEAHSSFPGLDRLFKSNSATEAAALARQIDLRPDDLLEWVHWNVPRATDDFSQRLRAQSVLSIGSRIGGAIYGNSAHRSSYWMAQTSAIAASSISTSGSRFSTEFPSHLRGIGKDAGRDEGSKQLASFLKCSLETARIETWPLIEAAYSKNDADPLDVELAIGLGLECEDHLRLSGLELKNRKNTQIREKWERLEANPIPPPSTTDNQGDTGPNTQETFSEEKGGSGQLSLESFL